MADISSISARKPVGGPPDGAANGVPTASDEASIIQLIELLFFAYRDFISDPDAILAEFGFGRAHHRVLHFVCRQPGLRVADLLVILQITKQSLSRVLRQLIEKGYVRQCAGEEDRRERRLYPTAAGEALFAKLIEPQLRRVRRAVEASGSQGTRTVEMFLLDMIKQNNRTHVRDVIRRDAVDSKLSE